MLVGFIKLHRKFKEWQWYKDVPTKTLFIELLLRCQYTPSECEGFILEEGQLIASRNDLAKDSGLTESQVRTALSHLKSSQEITCKLANNSTKKKTVITIVNWRKYQTILNIDSQENNQENNQEDSQPIKKIKNNKKYNPLLSPLKKGGRKRRENKGSYDLELFEEMLKGKD